MTKNTPLLAFQLYQQAFTAHLRNPENDHNEADIAHVLHKQLRGVPAKRLKVYEEIVYTNISEALCACFPVASRILEPDAWHDVMRGFLSMHSASSPFFREIPAEFLSYLKQVTINKPKRLPAFILSLCHYEWLELAASTYHKSVPAEETDALDFKSQAIFDKKLIFSSSVYLCHYDYAVHAISPDNVPTQTTPTQILIYCDADFKVQFLLLNPVTLFLLYLLRGETKHWSHHVIDTLKLQPTVQTPYTIGDALLVVANTMPGFTLDKVMSFGLTLLMQLHQQGVIIGAAFLEAHDTD